MLQKHHHQVVNTNLKGCCFNGFAAILLLIAAILAMQAVMGKPSMFVCACLQVMCGRMSQSQGTRECLLNQDAPLTNLGFFTDILLDVKSGGGGGAGS